MPSKNLKIMVISSKGGVGKSTTSMQLVAPYLYRKNDKQPINFYEFDDENNDCLSFGASELSKRQVVEVSTPILREKLTEIISNDEMCCLDIGGNKSTTIVIDALNENGMINFIDLAIIPLLDGEQDSINASVVYTLLKDSYPDLKCLFVLNRAKNQKYLKYQFENFFGDLRGIFQNKYALTNYLFESDQENYTYLLDDDVIKYSRRFGLTVYEIASKKRDFITQMKVNMNNLSDADEIKVLSFKNYVNKSADKYYKDVLRPAFKKIDSILGV